jgi:hypothetical protein
MLAELEKNMFFNWQCLVYTDGNYILSIVSSDVDFNHTLLLWLPIGTLFNSTNLAGGKQIAVQSDM